MSDTSDTQASQASQLSNDQAQFLQRSRRVVTDSVIAFATQQGILYQQPHQVGSDQGCGDNLKETETYTSPPDEYSDESSADINDGINLYCSCIICGSKQKPKGFIKCIGFGQPCYNIPQIISEAKCPECEGTPINGATIIVTMGFYNCNWNIKGKIKGEEEEFKLAKKTPLLQETLLLPETAKKVEFNYIQIWCSALK